MTMADVQNVRVSGLLGINLGVFWYVWGLYGFWWGVLYGIGAPVWIGFRIASYFLGGQ